MPAGRRRTPPVAATAPTNPKVRDMDKVLAFLEKYVQWLALGVGTLFLALMVYWYVIQEPVTVALAGQKLTPGEVDKAIAESPDIRKVKQAINSTAATLPTVVIPPVTKEFTGVINKPPTMPRIDAVGGVVDEGNPGGVPAAVTAVLSLPVVPAATYVAGDSYAARAVTPYTVLQPPPPAPVPGAPATPVAVVPPPVVKVDDIDYVSSKFRVKVADLVQMMAAAGIKPDDPILANRFQFLGVEVRRQEKSPTGEWEPGEGTVVGTLPVYSAVMKRMPSESDSDQDKFTYVGWAGQNLKMLMQPPFPQVTSGQPWYEPGTAAPAPIIPPPTVGTPAAGVAAPGSPLPPTVARPAFVPVAPVAPGAGLDIPDDGGLRGTVQGSTGVPSTPGQIPGDGVPDGAFNPIEVQNVTLAAGMPGEISIFAHDVTCQAGKTYRYKVRYWMRNPYWKASRNIKPELAKPFALASPDSPWTEEQTIKPRVEVFAQSVEPNRDPTKPDVARFDVFVARDNRWPMQTVRLSAGDPIAKKTASETWNSGMSVVDIRKDPKRPGKSYLILADAYGHVERRDIDRELTNARYVELKTMNAPPVVPGATPPGVTPAGRPVRPGRLGIDE